MRTKNEKDRGAIPYPKVQAKGDPRWAVNEIDLPEEQEDLRDTLFKSILGRCLVRPNSLFPPISLAWIPKRGA